MGVDTKRVPYCRIVGAAAQNALAANDSQGDHSPDNMKFP